MNIRYCWKKIKIEPAFAFLCNFLLVMAIFSICRVCFFVVNAAYFPDMTFGHMLELMWGGLSFDLTALLYINLLYLVMQLLPFKFRYKAVYQKIAKWGFIFLNSIVIIVNCMDIPFFRFTNRRTTFTIFSEFKNENNLLEIILDGALSYWYVTIFIAAIIFILCKLYYNPFDKSKQQIRCTNVVYYISQTVILLVFVYFTIIGIRGGFGKYTRPITLSNASKYVNKSNETAIVLNTPFCMLRTMTKKVYKNPKYFNDDAQMEAIFNPLHQSKPEGEFKPLNVVIIIWESFGKEYSGFFNNELENGTYKGFTPFMDSLLAEGFTFKYSYSNGRKSIDAMPSILSSIPMLIEPYILTSYSTNDITGIANTLQNKGYYSAFFHGAPNSSMGFQAYAKAAGFDDYFGKNEYNGPNAFDGTWAIWDEEFLQFYANEMGKMKQPFVTSVFTASSHHPFKIPAKYEGKFPEGTHPIHQSIAYSDYAFRHFFKRMSGYDWFDNTLFVITADHTNQVSHEMYFTDQNLYSVPILFYHQGSNLKGLDTLQLAQQIDIMPSVLSYLNYDEPYLAFGSDIIHAKNVNKPVVNYNAGLYQIYQDDFFMQFDGKKTKSFYNFKTDPLLTKNLVGTATPQQEEMVNYLKAFIQQYIIRITENNLRVKQ